MTTNNKEIEEIADRSLYINPESLKAYEVSSLIANFTDDELKELIECGLRTKELLEITDQTEWEKGFEHLSVNNLLREKDPTYGEENKRAKQQLKTFITQLLASRDTYWKEQLQKAREKCSCDKWHDRMEDSNNSCSTCDKPII